MCRLRLTALVNTWVPGAPRVGTREGEGGSMGTIGP
jgi:hypothetical protein